MLKKKSILFVKLVSFIKKNFIFKEKSGTVTKVKLLKITFENLRSIIYNSFILELWD